MVAEQLLAKSGKPSAAGLELLKIIKPLAHRALSEEEERAVLEIVGQCNLDPLHYSALYSCLRLSVGQVAALVGKSKSATYRTIARLGRLAMEVDFYPAASGFSGILALDEKWLKMLKTFTLEERKAGKKWRYAHFAVDAVTGDLLHVDVYEDSSPDHARAFLDAVRAKGIRPKVVVTDMWASYEKAIEQVFGKRVVHHFCLFHHLQSVRRHLREQCGKNWKDQPLLMQLALQIERIYDCRTSRTAKKRLEEVLALRGKLEVAHPEVLPLLNLLEKRFPKVANALDTPDVPMTNNVTERVIRAFNQHYKTMCGLESLPTARLQVALFRLFYRLTPQRETKRKDDRDKCPLERAGFEVRGTPLGDYVRGLTEALVEEREEAA